ncbi:SPW repeat protein [Bradyrhizobium sp. Tv2a-2]|uniref:SPW repeat protein n=1 Tax=Bradyrhizobium sp. Tv2a-2 TaxID=113395 RepID=UPI00040F5DEA|nr:SPW repeat protein [Bradyrhizobium sp. Tv2a-2]
MRRWQRESVLDLYNLLLAALLFVAPWLFRLTNGPGKMDLWATGAVIAVISLAAMIAYKDWEEWTNFLLGLWLIVSPWLLGFAHTRAMHLSIGVGIVVAFLAVLDLWLHYDAAHLEPPRRDRADASAASHQH